MSKDKISDYSATANSNTDIGGINIDEGCAPSGINDAIRTLMKQLKDWQSGSQDVYIHPAGSASAPSITATGDTNTGLFFPAADTVGISTGGTERARVDSSGNLLVGTTTKPDTNLTGVGIVSSVGKWALAISADNRGYVYSATNDGYPAYFVQGGSTVGYIATTSTTTTYTTSSDYRLKNNIAPMTDALAKVAALKPVTYKWNADGSNGEGFIAHELAEVCPQAVTGEKDAVDEEGNPVYQGIDTSFLVATLTAALQELNAKFEAYKAAHP